jgi:hypothetical protein
MAYELHVELQRLRELANAFGKAAQGISGVTASTTTSEVAATLNCSATGDACHSGAQAAQATLRKLTSHYRILRTGIHTSADSYETHDSDQARRIEALRKSL